MDFIGAKVDGGGGDNWSYKMCKAPVKMSPPTNQHPVFIGPMPFLSPNQQCQHTEGKNPMTTDKLNGDWLSRKHSDCLFASKKHTRYTEPRALHSMHN